jgi:hypothetical protein
LPCPPCFNASYGGTHINGIFVCDNATIGDSHLENLEFAMAESGIFTDGGGIIGLSLDIAEFGPNRTYTYRYPTLIDTMYNESLIDSHSFGLFLNNSSESPKQNGSLTLNLVKVTLEDH